MPSKIHTDNSKMYVKVEKEVMKALSPLKISGFRVTDS